MGPLLVLRIKVKNKPRLQEQGFKSTESMTWGVHLRLDGVKSRHVHLEQPVFPVHSGDPAVMDAPRYVPKPFPIFPKAVLLIIHTERARRPELKNNILQADSQQQQHRRLVIYGDFNWFVTGPLFSSMSLPFLMARPWLVSWPEDVWLKHADHDCLLRIPLLLQWNIQ